MQGHWARAVSAAQALTTPSGALPQVIQAESSLQAGKLEEAEQLLHSALQIDPQNEVSGFIPQNSGNLMVGMSAWWR